MFAISRSSSAAALLPVRQVALLRSGRRHGPITRLMTPWDIGELTQPFVFLGYSELAAGPQALLGALPPSGTATLTLVLSGALTLEGRFGTERTLAPGGYQWTTTNAHGWHRGGRVSGTGLRAFQLWLELPAKRPNAPPENLVVAAHDVAEEGAVRVVLGRFGEARSRLADALPDVNYFHVRLRPGERWCYAAPDGHNVTWLAVDRGELALDDAGHIHREQLAVFGDSGGAIEVQAVGATSFVLGSARRGSHPLVPSGDFPIDTTLAPYEEKSWPRRRPSAQHRR